MSSEKLVKPRRGISELIRKLIKEELKDEELVKLALNIFDAYLKDGKKGIMRIIEERFNEALKHVREA